MIKSNVTELVELFFKQSLFRKILHVNLNNNDIRIIKLEAHKQNLSSILIIDKQGTYILDMHDHKIHIDKIINNSIVSDILEKELLL